MILTKCSDLERFGGMDACIFRALPYRANSHHAENGFTFTRYYNIFKLLGVKKFPFKVCI